MSLNLYDLSVPLFIRALGQLKDVLQKGEQWAKDNNVEESKVIESSIIEDMKTLPFQVTSACNSAKGITFRIGGEENVAVEDNQKTFKEFYERIDSTLAVLKSCKKEKFVAPDAVVKMKLGPQETEFQAMKYLVNFAIPNFFFHVVTAYNILRKQGVPVGKLDFLGAKDLTTG